MRSIRAHLTRLLVLSMGFLLLGTSVLFYAVIRSHLIGEFDRALLAKAKALITLTEDEGDRIEFDFADEFMPEFSDVDRPEYFSLWLATGALIEKSDSLGTRELPRFPGLAPEPVFRNLVLPNGLRGRLVQVAFVPQVDTDEDEMANDTAGSDAPKPEEEKAPEDEIARDPAEFPDRTVVLVLAQDRQRLDALLSTLGMSIAAVVLLLLCVMIGLIRGALRIGLRPLDDVQRQVAQLDAHSLDKGVQMHTQTQELQPMVNQLNAMLYRLDAAFDRERQFTSDVAHELRTPIAELRTLTEVSLRWPDDQTLMQSLQDAHDISLQMERVVVTLLALTRYEGGTQEIRRSIVNLRDIIDGCWLLMERKARDKGLTFACDVPPSCCITSDRDMLSMVLTNLLSNAVAYSPAQSQIGCTLVQHGSKKRLTLSNPTDTLTPGDIPHIFERFWRKDPARSDTCHAGLGLSLVKAFSDCLGLDVHVELDDHHIFSITLCL